MSRKKIILITPQIMGAIYLWPFCTSCAPWMGFLYPLPPALGCWAWLPMAGDGTVFVGTPTGVECLPVPHYGLEEYLAFGEGSWYWGWMDTLLLWGGGWSVFLGKGINWDAWSFGGGHLALEEEMLIPGDGC